jgi:hypothetical protein
MSPYSFSFSARSLFRKLTLFDSVDFSWYCYRVVHIPFAVVCFLMRCNWLSSTRRPIVALALRSFVVHISVGSSDGLSSTVFHKSLFANGYSALNFHV